jgi:hypothetical protein
VASRFPANQDEHPSTANPVENPATSLPQWKCEFSKSDRPWTVGDRQILNCQGEASIQPLGTSAQLSLTDKKLDYTLSLLEVVQSDPNKAQLVVTGYKPGNFTSSIVVESSVGDGKTGFKTEPLQWQITSVIQQKSKQEPPKPYPQFGPYKLNYPGLWFVLVGVAIVLAVTFVVLKLKKMYDRKKLRERLQEHSSALGAFHQFNKDLRGIVREIRSVARGNEFSQSTLEKTVVEMDRDFKMYLVRELLVPANEWGRGATLSEIKRTHKRIYREFGGEIKTVLSELDKAKGATPTYEDCEQLAHMARKTVESVHKLKIKEKSE